jgi:hypothetical protein
MRLRARRQKLAAWSLPRGPGDRNDFPLPHRSPGARRIRRCFHIGGVLILIGLMRLARAVRHRWRPLAAGTVLTVAGLMLGNSPASIIIVPGLVYLLIALVMDGGSAEERKRRAELARELAGYATSAQRHDLEATLDSYPDAITSELREILARQAGAAAGTHMIPGAGLH